MTDEREDGDVAARAGGTDATADDPGRDVGGAAEEFDPPSSDEAEEAAASDSERAVGDRDDVPEDVREELRELREDLESFESEVEDRTVDRDEVEADLRRYVRRRVRRGHARGWGPYLVLLYGTAMTLGAFYLLGGWVSIAAMVVIWLSTLGLYVFMVVVGLGLSVLGIPGRLRNAVGDWRS